MDKELRHKLNLNQWKNTEDLIDSFKGINDKQLCKFVILTLRTSIHQSKNHYSNNPYILQRTASKFPVKTKPSSNMQESLCFSTSNKPGSKKKVDYLM